MKTRRPEIDATCSRLSCFPTRRRPHPTLISGTTHKVPNRGLITVCVMMDNLMQ
jgi:hypothetical protein